MKRLLIESPPDIQEKEIIGDTEDCFCGLPNCQGHPLAIDGNRKFVEFTREQYDWLLADLHRRMKAGRPLSDFQRHIIEAGTPTDGGGWETAISSPEENRIVRSYRR